MRFALPFRRRQFSLRTLLALWTVVGIGLGWIGYQVQWIRERTVAREWLHAHEVGMICGCGLATRSNNPGLPWSLAILGEKALPESQLLASRDLQETAYWQQIARCGVLFPECRFCDLVELARRRHAEIVAVRPRLDPHPPEPRKSNRRGLVGSSSG